MLNNFFQLNPGPVGINSQADFQALYDRSDNVDNVIYWPDELAGISSISKLKIKSITFLNVSFKNTLIKNVEFSNCHFEDCLFLGATIENSKFLECSFKGVNTYGITITDTYLNPSFFKNNFKWNHYTKSNIAVQLFQELYNNAVKQDITDFSKIAKYHILLWEDKLLISKYHFNRPYPIKWYKYYSEIIPNSFFRYGFGYGFRLRNFVVSFMIIFFMCFLYNKDNWQLYNFHERDFNIEDFTYSSYSHYANLFYTLDVLTKSVDSQFQPSSNFGMIAYSVQGGIGLIFFSLLVTVLINKFVK